MVVTKNPTEPSQLVELANNASLKKTPGISVEDIRAWKNGQGTPNTEQIGAIVIGLLKAKRIFISKDNHSEAQKQLLRARQINSIISSMAEGSDTVLHDVIEESLDEIHQFLE